ncbi:hypothetical protein [Kitasatospora griseola]|uniref:hypothetical protein n=1 Tax=Kitasatospora griseola TaxID=2064 RepID=UPI0038063832
MTDPKAEQPEPAVPGTADVGLQPRPWWRRRAILTLGAIAVVLAVAGTALAYNGSSAENGSSAKADTRKAQEQARNRAPFDEAVDALAQAQGVQYKDASAANKLNRQVTVTAYGDKFGTAGWGGLGKLDREAIRVGGTMYTRHAPGTTTDGTAPDGRPVKQWSTANEGDDYTDHMFDLFVSPTLLAHRLSNALDDDPRLPVANDPNTPVFTVGNTPALRADTTAGYLYISKDSPHRVLRLEPPNMLAPLPVPTSTARFELPRAMEGHQELADSTGMDIAQVADADAPQMYDTLEQETKELATARDSAFDFQLATGGDINCSPAGCHVGERFTATVTPKEKARLKNGKVTVTLSVPDITIDGTPAGSCQAGPQTVMITGDTAEGSIACDDPSGGTVFVAMDQKAQAEAQRQANASGGSATVTFYDRATAYVDALAEGAIEVPALVEQQKNERKDECAPSAASTTVPAVYSGAKTIAVYADASDPDVKRPCARLRDNLAAAEEAAPLIESLKKNGTLPPNYLTKPQASASGWKSGKALGNSVANGQLGGDVYSNTPTDPKAEKLPNAPGRVWYEADVGVNPMVSRPKQPGWRMLYSNDGQLYVTSEHYYSFYKLPDWK